MVVTMNRNKNKLNCLLIKYTFFSFYTTTQIGDKED